MPWDGGAVSRKSIRGADALPGQVRIRDTEPPRKSISPPDAHNLLRASGAQMVFLPPPRRAGGWGGGAASALPPPPPRRAPIPTSSGRRDRDCRIPMPNRSRFWNDGFQVIFPKKRSVWRGDAAISVAGLSKIHFCSPRGPGYLRIYWKYNENIISHTHINPCQHTLLISLSFLSKSID